MSNVENVNTLFVGIRLNIC